MLRNFRSILVGAMAGAVGSCLLSLSLEPEVSELRMTFYGGFIGLISASISGAIADKEKLIKQLTENDLLQQKMACKDTLNKELTQHLVTVINKRLYSLPVGSPEYFRSLEILGDILSPKNATPDTKD